MGEARNRRAASEAKLPEGEHAELWNRLATAVRAVCPPWLAAHCDDLVQEAWLRVGPQWEKCKGYPSSYLWKVAQSVVIDEIRNRRRKNEMSLEQMTEGGSEIASPGTGPERERRRRELAKGVWECLAKLNRPRRLALTLHLEGYSPAEAAPLLGWSQKRVYNLVHRGKRDLRECLRSRGLVP